VKHREESVGVRLHDQVAEAAFEPWTENRFRGQYTSPVAHRYLGNDMRFCKYRYESGEAFSPNSGGNTDITVRPEHFAQGEFFVHEIRRSL
jgi:hypothetical protein